MTSLATETAMQEILGLDPNGPRVVAVGGGHGLAQVLIAAQEFAGAVDAVVTVADDGGSSGRLTRALDILPPGDMRRCLLALSPEPSLWREVFEFRFERSDVAGHSLGNLVLAALSEVFGDFETALQVAGRALGALGRVIPASRNSLHLQAVIDGRLVDGQAAITTARGTVSELRLVPSDERANPLALEALAAATQIVIGPGSLFTSVIAALAVPGIVPAIGRSGAQVVYVCNITTQDGETLDMDATRHVEALMQYTGLEAPFTVVANTNVDRSIAPPQGMVEIDEASMAGLGVAVETHDLVNPLHEWPEHDPAVLGRVLAGLARRLEGGGPGLTPGGRR